MSRRVFHDVDQVSCNPKTKTCHVAEPNGNVVELAGVDEVQFNSANTNYFVADGRDPSVTFSGWSNFPVRDLMRTSCEFWTRRDEGDALLRTLACQVTKVAERPQRGGFGRYQEHGHG